MTIDPDSGIRKQDGSEVINSVATNSIGRDLAWNWLRNDWDRISAYYDPKSTKTVNTGTPNIYIFLDLLPESVT